MNEWQRVGKQQVEVREDSNGNVWAVRVTMPDGTAYESEHLLPQPEEFSEGLLRRVLGAQLGIDPDEITLVDNLRDDMNADELDMVEIAISIEEAMRLEDDLPDGHIMENNQTFGQLLSHYRDAVDQLSAR